MDSDLKNEIICTQPLKKKVELSDKKRLKNEIEDLPEQYHLIFLEILQRNKEIYSENMYGIFVTLNNISVKTYKEMNEKLKFIKNQIKNSQNFEKEKQDIKNNFFCNS